MAVVTDRVVVELFAKLDRYDTAITKSRGNFERSMASQQAAAVRTERQIVASAGNIRKALLASASGLGAAFGLNEIKNLADGYTRFTNQLKVAGLEGGRLATTQDQLFQIAQRNGVPLEDLGTLYGRLAQGAKELGASQSELIRFSSGVAAAVRIQGAPMEKSRDALLQLTQALGGEIVRAEEFNSINEGARPILQAVANGIDRYRGSVSKLRNDVVDGKVKSDEFFRGFLAGSAKLEAQASKANLTIGASFTVLNNALGKYIGETDAALSATERVSQGIIALANNLDTIVPALAAIGAAYGARALGGAAFGAAATAVQKLTGAEREAAEAILKGNAAYVSRSRLEATRATLARQSAQAQAASIQTTVAALREERAQLLGTVAAIEQQRAAALQAQAAIKANAAAGFGTLGVGAGVDDAARANQDLKAQIVAKRALADVDQRLATAEADLAGHQTIVTTAVRAEEEAVKRATLAKRLGAAASALFTGTLSALAGALPILAIGALVGAIIAYRQRVAEAAANTKAINERARELADRAREAATQGRAAAGAISQIGDNAASNTGKVAAFAGAVGDLAENLRQVAEQRRNAKLDDLKEQERAAAAELATAKRSPFFDAKQGDRRRLPGTLGLAGGTRELSAAERQAQNAVKKATENLAKIRAERVALEKRDLADEIKESDRTGGRDLKAELDRLGVDLAVARKRGVKEEINDLEAEVYERKRTIALMKEGSSFTAAETQARREAARLREAGAEKIAEDASQKADRADAAVARREEAAARREAAAELIEARKAVANDAEIARAEDDVLAARQSLAASAEERARLELQRIAADKAARDRELVDAGATRDQELVNKGPGGTGVLSAEEVATLRAQNAANTTKLRDLNAQAASLAAQSVLYAEAERQAADLLAVQTSSIGNQVDLLTAQAQLAETAAERRTIEMRLLDLQYEEEKARLDAVIASREASEAEKEIARRRLAMLPELQAADQERARRDTESPLASFAREANRTTAEMDEAMGAVAVDGLAELNSGLTDAIVNFRNLGDTAYNVFNSIAERLVSLQIEKFLTGPLAKVLGGAFSAAPTLDFGAANAAADAALASVPSGLPGSGDPAAAAAQRDVTALGDAASSASSALLSSMIPSVLQSAVSAITGATADSVAAGASVNLTTQATLAAIALNYLASAAIAAGTAQAATAGFAKGGLPGFASGGLPPGLIRGPGTGTSDSIVARVSNREFINTADSTRKNYRLLSFLNRGGTLEEYLQKRGGVRGFASGGLPSMRVVQPLNAAAAPAGGSQILSRDFEARVGKMIATAASRSSGDVTVVNAVDAGDFVSRGLSTPVGGRAFMNYIRTNARAVRSAIGS